MYEYMTFEVILQRMLDKVPSTEDKREGSVIYDALAPAAFELALMYIEADVILNETFADTASRQYLIKRAAERGIIPEPATKAILKGQFSMNVPIGSRYSLDDLNYIVTEKISDGIFKLECETVGRVGNGYFGNLIPIDYIAGLQTAKITELLITGEDEEDTEVFRQRYENSFDNQAYGGNIADYQEKTKKIQGIGGVKVYPIWAGGGTVKLVIISSEFTPPTEALIDMAQTIIDPIPNQGEGLGVAPIGHVVTVQGVTTCPINIVTNIVYASGGKWENVKPNAEEFLDAYYLELSKKWEESEALVIRISQIESRLLEVNGIIDIFDTAINGVKANLILDADAIPVRGDISEQAG